MKLRILFADDDQRYRELVSDFLEENGFEVLLAKDGSEAIDLYFSEQNINLVILDVLMPVYNGWEVCEQIRTYSDVPILMLTALDDQENEIKGLNVGADDYIAKPYSYDVFIARINALLRKIINEKSKELKVEGIIVNQINQTVSVHNQIINLSPKEYLLLVYLISNNGQALSREQILNGVWGYDFYGDTRTVDSHIKSIRAKLGEYGELIRTVRCLGYEMRLKK